MSPLIHLEVAIDTQRRNSRKVDSSPQSQPAADCQGGRVSAIQGMASRKLLVVVVVPTGIAGLCQEQAGPSAPTSRRLVYMPKQGWYIYIDSLNRILLSSSVAQASSDCSLHRSFLMALRAASPSASDSLQNRQPPDNSRDVALSTRSAVLGGGVPHAKLAPRSDDAICVW
jgi:hypothetical protein